MKAPALRVIKSGVNSQIQDNGRFGCLQMGLSQSGVMDEIAYQYNNALLNNADHVAVIEIAMGGAEFEFITNSVIAITGASAELKLNGQSINNWASHAVNEGDKLLISGAKNGLFIYLGIAGGFLTEPVKGSQSTTLRLGLGGFYGRALKANDYIDYMTNHHARTELTLPRHVQQQYFHAPIYVIPSYQYSLFSQFARDIFFNSKYKLLRGDRMGYFFESSTALTFDHGELNSEGILPGAIQITHTGQPIVLHRDAQSIGGYPKMGALTRHSLSVISQLIPSKQIQFQLTDRETAKQQWHTEYQQIKTLQNYWYPQ